MKKKIPNLKKAIDEAAWRCRGQNKLAEKIGVSPKYLSNLKRYEDVHLARALEICEASGLTINQFCKLATSEDDQ